MLFFELFPAFMAIVALIAGIWLFLADRRARQESSRKTKDSDKTSGAQPRLEFARIDTRPAHSRTTVRIQRLRPDDL